MSDVKECTWADGYMPTCHALDWRAEVSDLNATIATQAAELTAAQQRIAALEADLAEARQFVNDLGEVMSEKLPALVTATPATPATPPPGRDAEQAVIAALREERRKRRNMVFPDGPLAIAYYDAYEATDKALAALDAAQSAPGGAGD